MPGAQALMAWFLGVYGTRGGRNGGIYGCRTIAGTSTRSVHSEGRAADLMNPTTPAGAQWSQDLADWLVYNSAELGVQLVIHARRVWSCRYPEAGWRRYTGANPHDNHSHVELSRESARTLTVARIDAVAAALRTELTVKALPTLRRAADSKPDPFVARAQALLEVAGYDTGDSGTDGEFGPDTEEAVRKFQYDHKLDVDGIIGPGQTWPALLGVH